MVKKNYRSETKKPSVPLWGQWEEKGEADLDRNASRRLKI